ncbi:hypothetical protein HPB50_023809 [Hyalomma asiaticum]|uniref:Uncharacterized protein n=1 Tax=Hyalomma asiaticum TaxID=266040 RepID=A0ACB7SS28_HYAAI|nr:hypothetical protein HPB50_023809 [Hyalomma asiaticum]
MDQWIAVLLRRWRNGILPSMWKAEITKKLESSGAALTQSVELMLDVQERFAAVPNGPVADRVTAKLKAVLDKNPGFYVLKQVSNVLSGTDSKIPGFRPLRVKGGRQKGKFGTLMAPPPYCDYANEESKDVISKSGQGPTDSTSHDTMSDDTSRGDTSDNTSFSK